MLKQLLYFSKPLIKTAQSKQKKKMSHKILMWPGVTSHVTSPTAHTTVSRAGCYQLPLARSPRPTVTLATLTHPYPRLSPFTMYHDVDSDFMRAWQLLHELSEQNAVNMKMSTNLHSLTDALKVNRNFVIFTSQTPM